MVDLYRGFGPQTNRLIAKAVLVVTALYMFGFLGSFISLETKIATFPLKYVVGIAAIASAFWMHYNNA
jgi:hypothetical protein